MIVEYQTLDKQVHGTITLSDTDFPTQTVADLHTLIARDMGVSDAEISLVYRFFKPQPRALLSTLSRRPAS